MAGHDPIWECARRDLVFVDDAGNREVFVWEHSERVASGARMIAALPDVAVHEVDTAALEAAALYHDAGWTQQLRDGRVRRVELLCKPTSDQQRDLAAVALRQALSEHLRPHSLEMAILAVRQLNHRQDRSPEATILADADHLDEIGCLSLWNTFRRHTFEGRGMAAILGTWQRQREFRFWEARVSKSIHFEPVRRIALRRLEQLDRFMSLLARQDAGEDIAESTTPPIRSGR